MNQSQTMKKGIDGQTDRPEERMQNRNVIRDVCTVEREATECAEICHTA
jgi:hypothetical protein